MTREDSAVLGWKEYIGNEMVRAVLITTPERSYAPSWAHYLTAEGNDRELSIYFSMCVVRIKGFGLDRLLRKLITQRIGELFVPKRTERIRQSDDTPGISELTVEAKGGKSRG
jgi:hypothetical protein